MITTQNPTWGFSGTLTTGGVANADDIFDAAARALTAQLGLTNDEARAALDAKVGRHIADQRVEGEEASALIARLIQQGWSNDIRRAAGLPVSKSRKPGREVTLAIQHDEVPVLRFALDHALASISEAHAEDRAQLATLIRRLEEATR